MFSHNVFNFMLVQKMLQSTIAAIMLGLPGYALASLWKDNSHELDTRLTATLANGAAAIAYMWLLASYLSVSIWSAIVLLEALSVAVIIYSAFRDKPTRWSPAIVLIPLAFAIVLMWRIWQIRNLAFPAWVDSVHHALIIRKMLETNGVPNSLSPYIELPFFYHFGFHALVATFCSVMNVSIPQSMLIVGQILQVGAVASVYRLGRVLWPERFWAVIAALFVTFVSAMPSFYTSWGKYPLLTAITLLPFAMATSLEILNHGGTTRLVVTMALIVAGAIISHSFGALLLTLFVVIVAVQAILAPKLLKKSGEQNWQWLYLLLGTGLGVMLVWPWIWRVWLNAGRFFSVQVGGSALVPDKTYFPGYLSYLWAMLGPDRNRLLLACALPGVGIALRRPQLRPIALWLLVLLLLASPWGWRLNPFSPDQVIIIFFLPGVLLATETLRTCGLFLSRADKGIYWTSRLAWTGIAIVVLGFVLWGVIETQNLVSDDFILATSADSEAFIWIQEHVSPQARFFIVVVPWQPYGYRGVDGGWWILPMTGRQTLLPPAVYGLGDSKEVERLHIIAGKASEMAACSPEFLDLMIREKLDYVYFNSQRSSIDPSGFDNCSRMRKVYAYGGVFIYQLI